MSESTNDFPRRGKVDEWTDAERAIQDAVDVVERAGAHPLLTDAVILLAEARAKVADFVDGPEHPIARFRAEHPMVLRQEHPAAPAPAVPDAPQISDAEAEGFYRHAEDGATADWDGVEYALIQPYDLQRFAVTVMQLRAQLAQREAALAEARKDTERLDWLLSALALTVTMEWHSGNSRRLTDHYITTDRCKGREEVDKYRGATASRAR